MVLYLKTSPKQCIAVALLVVPISSCTIIPWRASSMPQKPSIECSAQQVSTRNTTGRIPSHIHLNHAHFVSVQALTISWWQPTSCSQNRCLSKDPTCAILQNCSLRPKRTKLFFLHCFELDWQGVAIKNWCFTMLVLCHILPSAACFWKVETRNSTPAASIFLWGSSFP